MWGLYFGLLLILEKCFLSAWLERCPKICGHLYTMSAVLAGMTVFALDSLPQGLNRLAMLAGSAGRFWNGETVWLLSNYGILFAVCVAGAAGLGKRLARYPAVWALSFVLSVAYLVDASYNPFLYFRF